MTAVELISRPRTAGPFLLRNHKVFFLSRAQRRLLFYVVRKSPHSTIKNNRAEHNRFASIYRNLYTKPKSTSLDAVHTVPQFMKVFFKAVRLGAIILAGTALLGVIAVAVINFYFVPHLPSADALRDERYQVPLRVYSADDKLLAEYGELRRTPVRLSAVPDLMVKAVLAAEDDRFFHHPGVDYQGLLRAAWVLLTTGQKAQGGSTITMQVARNFFLGREKTYLRKLNEILLAFKIELEFTKEEILELYLNKIYLGQRAYGVAAAAQVYYGAELPELRVAQMAIIVGLFLVLLWFFFVVVL